MQLQRKEKYLIKCGFKKKIYIFFIAETEMHKYVEQDMEMRVIVVSLSVPPAACNHLH